MSLTTLRVFSWQRVVEHAIADGARVNISEILDGRKPRLDLTPGRCRTALPAIVCSCARFLIEVDDTDGPQAVGWEGRWD